MKKIIFALTIIFLVSGCSQTSSTFDLPENQGVSSERLDRIDSYLNKAIEKKSDSRSSSFNPKKQ